MHYVFPNFPIEPEALLNGILQLDIGSSAEILIFYDVGYHYSLGGYISASNTVQP